MTRAEVACLRPVLERLGMPYEEREQGGERWWGWNGRALNLAVRTDFSSVIHEVAHWQLAVPARRGLADFGLDEMLLAQKMRDGRLPPRKQYLPWGHPDEEEALASLLGILMERHLGLLWHDTWRHHAWDMDDHLPGKGWGATSASSSGLGSSGVSPHVLHREDGLMAHSVSRSARPADC